MSDINELLKSAEDLNAIIDSVSEEIRNIENKLRNLKLHLPFSYQFSESPQESLEWQVIGPDSRNYRLCYSKDGSIKPLIEMPLGTRIAVRTKISTFLDAFTQYIKGIREDIERSIG